MPNEKPTTADDLFGPVHEEPMTPEEAETAWKRFLAFDFTGQKIEYACFGGDMMKIEAIIVSIVETPYRVIIRIKDARWSPDGIAEEKWEPCPFFELHLDRHGEPPKTNLNIVLPPTIYPADQSLEIGFIFGNPKTIKKRV